MTGDIAECVGKKQFATYYQAQRAAQRLNRRQVKAKANPYKCPGNRHFHTGNTMKSNVAKSIRMSNNITIHGYNRKKRYL
jgi:hypothetical protein